MESLVAPSINLLILLGFLFYKLRAPAVNFVASRHSSIRSDVDSVRSQLRQAQEKYDEFTAKLKAVDAEVANLREQVKQDVAAAKNRILMEAKRASSQSLSDAQAAGEALYAELRGQLYGELSQHVLERAENVLRDRLTGDDRARIRAEFSHQVGNIQ